MKPHIRLVNGLWECRRGGVCAVGESPKKSYRTLKEWDEARDFNRLKEGIKKEITYGTSVDSKEVFTPLSYQIECQKLSDDLINNRTPEPLEGVLFWPSVLIAFVFIVILGVSICLFAFSQ